MLVKPQVLNEVISMLRKIFYSSLLPCLILSTATTCFAEGPKAIYNAQDAQLSGSKVIFEYKPESLYEIDCMTGRITDICLKPGESLTHIAAGDTVQWAIDNTTVNNVTHVYIKPIKDDISTNLIINTTTHSYRLILNATDRYTPIVDWHFTDEEKASKTALIKSMELKNSKASGLYNKGIPVKKHILNFNYSLKNKQAIPDTFLPVAIFDDGIHTYIRMPESNRYDLPVLYLVDTDNKMTIVNYRVKGNMFIADRTFTKGRLLFAKNVSVDFVPTKKKAGI